MASLSRVRLDPHSSLLDGGDQPNRVQSSGQHNLTFICAPAEMAGGPGEQRRGVPTRKMGEMANAFQVQREAQCMKREVWSAPVTSQWASEVSGLVDM